MAGTPHGIKDIQVTSGNNSNNTQETFKTMFDAFELAANTHGYVNRVALQYGSGGTGTDFHDGANPFGTNAFFVYEFLVSGRRNWTWYILIQWSAGVNFGSAPGNPGLRNGGTTTNGTIAWACAAALDSSGASVSPWNGTTANDGTDTKGATVWAAPGGGTLYVMPRSNDIGGSHVTNKENMGVLYETGTTSNMRSHVIIDEDSFWWIWNPFDDALTWRWMFAGPYVPAPDFNPTVPLVAFADSGDVELDAEHGDTAGTANEQGGIVAPDGAQTYTFRFRLPRFYALTNGTHGVSTYRGGGQEVLPFRLWVDDTDRGLAGKILVRDLALVGSASPEDEIPATGPVFDYITVGGAGATDTRLVIRWGATAARNTSARTGESF